MRKKFIIIYLLFVTAFYCISQDKEIKTALVFGNASYKERISNASYNAQLTADTLTRLGFDVILHLDADQRTMIDAINDFSKKIRNTDTSFIYFSGFAFQTALDGYILPVDAIINSEEDFAYKAISSADMLSKVSRSGCKRNFVFFDTAYYTSILDEGEQPKNMLIPSSVKDMEGLFMFSSLAPAAFNTKWKSTTAFTQSILDNILVEDADMRLSSGLIIKNAKDAAADVVILSSSSLISAYSFNPSVLNPVVKEEPVIAEVEAPAVEEKVPVVEEKKVSSQNLDILNTLIQKKAAAEKKYAAKKGSRTTGFITLGTGVVFAGAAAVCYFIIGQNAYDAYNASKYSTEAEENKALSKFMSAASVASAIASGVSLIISPITFIAGAGLKKVEAEVLDLDEQIALFNQQQGE